MVVLNPNGEYIVTFDPLDGSSVVDANMSVGSIFGIWKKREETSDSMSGYTGRDLVGAALASYGPRTSCLVYNTLLKQVDEISLHKRLSEEEIRAEKAKQDSEMWFDEHLLAWTFQRRNLQMKDTTSIYAPGNTRACLHNKAYMNLYTEWARRGFTLRYSGAMAPDCFLVLVKEEGLFVSLSAEDKGVKAKLRVLFECVPIAFLVEMTGGMTSFGD